MVTVFLPNPTVQYRYLDSKYCTHKIKGTVYTVQMLKVDAAPPQSQLKQNSRVTVPLNLQAASELNIKEKFPFTNVSNVLLLFFGNFLC